MCGVFTNEVAGRLVRQPRVVLQLAPDDPALRVEHGEAGPDLVREAEQVEVGAELAVVAAGRLLQQLQVVLELLAGGPGGPVHPLQLRVFLGTAPVGRGGAHQLDRRALISFVRRQVRTATQVGPDDLLGRRVDVVVDRELGRRRPRPPRPRPGRRPGPVALHVDELQLVRLVGQLRLGLVDRLEAAAPEQLAGLDDLLHPLFEPAEVVGLERLGHVEVVVEAVVDRRPDAELGVREHVLHRLREHVRGRVPEHGQAVRRLHRHRGDHGVLRRRPGQVPQPPVGVADDDDRLRAGRREAGGGDRLGARRPGRDGESVGRGGGDGFGHGELPGRSSGG